MASGIPGMSGDIVLATCVVVAFHDPLSITGLVAALTGPGLEVVVVNVEADEDVQRSIQGTGAVNVPMHRNLGYAAAVNEGARYGSAPVVIFMNDDVLLNRETALSLAAIVASAEADVVVPAVKTTEGRWERTIAALPTPRSLMWEWMFLPDQPVRWMSGLARPEKWRTPTGPERVDAAAAVVVGVGADLLREVPMPENYFLYWEESEWFWILHRRGAKVQYRPELVATHAGGRADVRSEKSRLLARNAIRCVRRTQGRYAALSAVPIVALWNLRLAALAAFRALIRPGQDAREVLRARLAGLGVALGNAREAWDGT
jgi:GT2 family glycosyltransferase